MENLWKDTFTSTLKGDNKYKRSLRDQSIRFHMIHFLRILKEYQLNE